MMSNKGSKKRRKMFSAIVSLVLALGMMCSSVSSVFAHEGSSGKDVNVTEDTVTVNGHDTVDITEADEVVVNDVSAAKDEKNDGTVAAKTSTSNVTFFDLNAVYVYDKYDNLIYRSEYIVPNSGTTNHTLWFSHINMYENTYISTGNKEGTA